MWTSEHRRRSGNGRFLAYIMMEKLAQAGEGGGCKPPFITFTITYKVAVYAQAEWADTITLYISSLPIYVLCDVNIPVPSVFWVMEVGIPSSPQLVSPHSSHLRSKSSWKINTDNYRAYNKITNFPDTGTWKILYCELPKCTSHSWARRKIHYKTTDPVWIRILILNVAF
jgi:hypothetical protein